MQSLKKHVFAIDLRDFDTDKYLEKLCSLKIILYRFRPILNRFSRDAKKKERMNAPQRKCQKIV